MWKLIALGIVWYLSGIFSFVYWWTKDDDIRFFSGEFFVMLVAGFIGIFAWIGGWSIHGEHNKNEKILFHKKVRSTK